jgi:hypothetical protein
MGSTTKRWAIEAKVVASTAASAAAGIVLAVLNDVQADHSLLGSTPAWAQALILVAVPPLAAFLAGYQARHTPREADTPSAPTGA